MSAGLDIDVFRDHGWETNECAVVSIYEDAGSRGLLLRVCESLASKFRDDLDFQFDWWRFKYLADPVMAMEAAQKAARADLILLATPSAELPSAVQEWFEGWLPNRQHADGALVLVQLSPEGISLPLESYLRTAAKRARLDYLPLFSSEFAATSELAELLAYDDRPVHWGINE